MEHVVAREVNITGGATRNRVTGQGMTEYIIIVALIALGSVVAVGFFGNAVKAQFVAMAAELTDGEGGEALTAVRDEVESQQGTAAATLGSYTGN